MYEAVIYFKDNTDLTFFFDNWTDLMSFLNDLDSNVFRVKKVIITKM